MYMLQEYNDCCARSVGSFLKHNQRQTLKINSSEYCGMMPVWTTALMDLEYGIFIFQAFLLYQPFK